MSNKTPPEPAKKIASAPRLLIFVYIILLLASFLLIGLVLVREPQTKFGDMQLRLERVSAPADLEKGLSGRQSMAEDQGMLFVFESPGERCFWMKDMSFPLDIIWLDADKKVVTIKENAQPDSYPESFCPDRPAKYVIEVNAGIADQAQISTGSQLQF